jgi:hypothetical protein
MQNKKRIIILVCIIIIAVVVIGGGIFVYQHYLASNRVDKNKYVNNEYGLEITLPNSWKGYQVIYDTWTGWLVDGGEGTNGDYQGLKIIFRNPKWTDQSHWQDIPIMVFTPEVWELVVNEKIGVSAAPIGPSKIGQNSKYIFATPPRWYGFTDDQGMEEAVLIVETFKAF